MIVYLDTNYNIVRTDEESIYRGSDRYNKLIVAIPVTLTNQYPTASFKRADGRIFGPLIHNKTTNDVSYNYYSWDITDRLAAVNGALEVTFTINFTQEGVIVKTKNVCMVIMQIYDAVISTEGDLIIINKDQVTNLTQQLNDIQALVSELKLEKQNIASIELKDEEVTPIATLSQFYQFFYERRGIVTQRYLIKGTGNTALIRLLGATDIVGANEWHLSVLVINDNIFNLTLLLQGNGFNYKAGMNEANKTTGWINYDYLTHVEATDIKHTEDIDQLKKDITFNRIGLLRAGDYNENTGVIELIYDADIISDENISYDVSTGILTVCYN